jgi:peroxiredoxin (alkyl hydroperoxide reductase subunit C)
MLRILDGLQAIDAKGALAPANWQPGEPLLKAPRQTLDQVFDAKDATSWFLSDERGDG